MSATTETAIDAIVTGVFKACVWIWITSVLLLIGLGPLGLVVLLLRAVLS